MTMDYFDGKWKPPAPEKTPAQQGREIVAGIRDSTPFPKRAKELAAFLASVDQQARDLEQAKKELERADITVAASRRLYADVSDRHLELMALHEQLEAKVAVLTEAAREYREIGRLIGQGMRSRDIAEQDAKLTAAGITL